MRFFADGPSIPEQLLEDRDNGNVVFFCGAGVSRPAGLPGFVELADQVIQELGAPPESKVRAMLERAKQEPDGAPPLDQIFSALQHEYRSADIDNIVQRLLKTPSLADVEQHQIILRLSKNAAQQIQIVTTNFDLLFERAQRDLRRNVAPALPDLSSGPPLTG
jgi:NAD-dependent SIR2 family protein deacetylase